jgi:putative component of membrane protein insertase Oxa1/YidC/SpoIIIJ protein YidD
VEFFYFLGGAYLLLLLAATLHKTYKIRRLRSCKFLGERELVSVFWAWCDSNSCADIFENIENQEIARLINREPGVNKFRLLMPHVLLGIFSISFYQFLRPAGASGIGDCNQTPNCSNYAIGCLLRFNFIEALKKSKTRILNCSGESRVCFSENIAEDFHQ